jgi:hypothetical protein
MSTLQQCPQPHCQVSSLWSHTHIVKWALYGHRQFTFYKNICYHYTKEIYLIVPSLFVTTARPQCALWSRAANSFGQTLMSRPGVEILQDVLPRKYGKHHIIIFCKCLISEVHQSWKTFKIWFSSMDGQIYCHWYKILGLLYKRAPFDLQFVHNLFWLKLKWNVRSKLFYFIIYRSSMLCLNQVLYRILHKRQV